MLLYPISERLIPPASTNSVIPTLKMPLLVPSLPAGAPKILPVPDQ